MGMSQTLTRESMFEPLRQRLGGMKTWFGYLVSCPYRASHYIAFVRIPLTGSYYVTVSLPWFVSSILVTVLAAFMRVAFWFFDETQTLVRREIEVA